MKKQLRSLGIFVLGMSLVVTLFSGCTKKETVQKSTNQDSNVQVKKEPLKLKIVNRLNADIKVEGNPVLKEIEKRANVILEYEAPPINNYVDRLQILIASGDMGDIVYLQTNADPYSEWSKNGVFVPLDDKLPKYKNINTQLTKESLEYGRVPATGKIHGIPKTNTTNISGLIIRQDWLDKLGLKAPSTADELLEVAKAFTNKDPDGNGKADTYGISTPLMNTDELGWQHYITSAFNYNNYPGVKDVDGKYKLAEKFEGYVPYLTYMRKLFSEKALDPEFLLNKSYGDRDKFYQGKIGIMKNSQTAIPNIEKEKIPIWDKITFLPPMKNDKGVRTYNNRPALWGMWSITNKCKDVDGALAFLDWGATDEAIALMTFGIKGVNYDDYDFKTQSITRNDQQTKDSLAVSSAYLNIMNVLADGSIVLKPGSPKQNVMAKYDLDLNNYKKETKIIDVPIVNSPLLISIKSKEPDLIKKKESSEFKYITGEISLEQFKTFLDKEYFPKLDAAEKEYIELMKKVK